MEPSKIKIAYRLIIVLVFITSLNSVFSQDDYEVDYTFEGVKKNTLGSGDRTEKIVYKFSFLLPEAGVEFSLAPKFSMDVSAKFGLAFGIRNSSPTVPTQTFVVTPFPIFHIEPKWNYNIKKRQEKGRKIDKFSSNFISLYTSYRIKVSQFNNHSILIGPTWGIQRNMGDFGYFKLNTGLGYFYQINPAAGSQSPLPFLPIIDVKLGVMF